jgi:hypothetical protein
VLKAAAGGIMMLATNLNQAFKPKFGLPRQLQGLDDGTTVEKVGLQKT